MSQVPWYPPPPGQTPHAAPLELTNMKPQPPAQPSANFSFVGLSHHPQTSQGPVPENAAEAETVRANNGESTYTEPQVPMTNGQEASIDTSKTEEPSTGKWNGGAFRISHQGANALLIVNLGENVSLFAKPGAMITMDPSMSLRGTVSFSWMKLFTRGDLAKSTYTAPQAGQVQLAPSSLGDIATISIDATKPESRPWKVGKDAFLASTVGVTYDYKAQSLTQAVFSGEGLFVYNFRGYGFLWVQSFGAIIKKELPKETDEIIIDNNHLVAWNCDYTIRRAASGGIISGVSSREGLACRFRGPGTVYYQSRKLESFAAQLKKGR